MSSTTDKLYARIEKFWKRNKVALAVIALIGIFLVLFFWNRMAVSIHSGEQGVLWSRFSGTNLVDTYEEGFYLIWPWNEMTVYSLRLREDQDTITVLTKDGMEIGVKFSILYRPLRQEISYIHQAIGPDYYQSLIRPVSISSIRQVIGTLRTEDIERMPEDSLLALIKATIHSDKFHVQSEDAATGRIVTTTVEGILPHNDDVERHQIIIDDLVNLFQVDVKLHTLELPPTVQEAINVKLVQEQEAQSYAFRMSVAMKEKERQKIEAEGIRDFQAISGISFLAYRGLAATQALAASPNSKIVIVGTNKNELPVMLNGDAK